MNNFSINGVLYTVLDANEKTIQVGTGDSNVDRNAVVGSIPKELRIIETYQINNEIYHVEVISYNAFRASNLLHTVYVPDSVKTLGHRCFDYSSLRHLFFSPNSRLTFIDVGALYGTNIKSINIPKTLNKCNSYCMSMLNFLLITFMMSVAQLDSIFHQIIHCKHLTHISVALGAMPVCEPAVPSPNTVPAQCEP